MVIYLKEVHIMIRYDHDLQKSVYSVTKTDEVSIWPQEIDSITPHIEFDLIKGKENALADILSRLRCLGLHDDNDPEESGQEYGKSIFDMDENTVNNVDSN